jgi:hypothetical protein
MAQLSQAEADALFDAAVEFGERWGLSVLAVAVGPDDTQLTLLIGPGDLLDGVLAFAAVIRPQLPEPYLARPTREREGWDRGGA